MPRPKGLYKKTWTDDEIRNQIIHCINKGIDTIASMHSMGFGNVLEKAEISRIVAVMVHSGLLFSEYKNGRGGPSTIYRIVDGDQFSVKDRTPIRLRGD